MTNLPDPSRSQHSRLDEALVQPSTGQRAMEEERIREELLKVAKPDSRYQLNLDFFISGLRRQRDCGRPADRNARISARLPRLRDA